MQRCATRIECFNGFDASGTPTFASLFLEPSSSAISASSHIRTMATQPCSRYVSVAVLFVHAGTRPVNGVLQRIPMVARVSVVDFRGHALLDTYVRPTHLVEDFRTAQTGLHYAHLANAPMFAEVQQQVISLIRDKIIVGHRIWTFLSVLGLKHPAIHTRDLALYRPLRRKLQSNVVVELDTLVHIYMGRNLGLDYENSLEIARACMDLFRSCRNVFEDVVQEGAWPCDLPPAEHREHYL
ncbi:hypothetical protein BDQ17DRAFT_1294436 [Cyathus striatus]|nr:hypothetical protein BDQ17DRAFT_1294436 [Cyathus striatus]